VSLMQKAGTCSAMRTVRRRSIKIGSGASECFMCVLHTLGYLPLDLLYAKEK
jgi:hypothetical protein